MTGLLLLELRRNLARRITRIALILATLGILINGVVQFATHHAGDDASFRAARQRVMEQYVEGCMNGSSIFGGSFQRFDENGEIIAESGPSVPRSRESCEQEIARLPNEAFGIGGDDRFKLEALRGGFLGTTVPLVMLALMLGASFIGAEWRANTIATQLVWEPRRIRVAGAKVLAAIITAVGVYVFLQSMVALSLLPAALWRGTTDVPAGWLATTLGQLLRGAGLVAVAAAAGHALGSAGRNTGAALGFAFVYLMILEGGLIGSIWPGTRRWLAVGNSIIWVSGETDFENIAGRSVVGAGLVLAFYAAAMSAASIAIFRARDVS